MFYRARLRLTLWYVAVLAVILLLFDLGAGFLLGSNLMSKVSDELHTKAVQAGAAMIDFGGTPRLDMALLSVDPTWVGIDLYAMMPTGEVWQPASSPIRSLLPDRRGLTAALRGQASYTTVSQAGGRLLVYSSPVRRRGSGDVVAVIQVASSIRSVDEANTRLVELLVVETLIALVFAFAAGFWLAGKALEPIRLNLQGQKQFVRDSSHELRTPLTVIRTAAESILRQKAPPSDRVRGLAQDIVAESEQLGRMVEDLGLLADADSRRFPPRREPVSVARLMVDVATSGRLLAESAGGRLEVSTGGAEGALIGDETRLRQLFSILIDNAFKFSPSGATVHLLAEELNRRLVARVIDEGPGIPEGDLPHIFDRFYRGASARQSEGSGLGLAIARLIVEQHGGMISVRSEMGRGSELVVELPLSPGSPVAAPVALGPNEAEPAS